ncbi:MAG: 1-acyl-sn-glycerol-3-phosphate acyltransferase [Gemmatimonadaceae bacterium]|nr:1-acyl-sn-glycerol-3-phosphate acyltransferase [Gemmatimonadaceae bacterium]
MDRLANYWVWGITVLAVLVGFWVVLAVFLVTVPFDRGRYAAGRAFRLVAVTAARLGGRWRFRTEGVAIRDPRRPYVAVSNHESYADTFLLSHLPWEMKWLGKEQLFRIPFLGWMMSLAGDIPLRRGNRESIVEAMNECADRLRKRVTVMIFPEGTRTPDGNLLPFKDGAFRLAIEHGAPILPICVAGTRRAMAKHTFKFLPTRAVARVLEPIPTTGLTLDDVATLKERTRAAIAAAKVELNRSIGLDPMGEPLPA